MSALIWTQPHDIDYSNDCLEDYEKEFPALANAASKVDGSLILGETITCQGGKTITYHTVSVSCDPRDVYKVINKIIKRSGGTAVDFRFFTNKISGVITTAA